VKHSIEPAWIALRCFAYSKKVAGMRRTREETEPPHQAMLRWVLEQDDQHLALQALHIAVEHRPASGMLATVLQVAEDAYSFARTLQSKEPGQPAPPVQAPRKRGLRAAFSRRSAPKD
jgi:hypothetical protein